MAKGSLKQLNVRIPEELIRRVSAVAGASGKSLADFVGETLDERTKEHTEDVQRMAQREKKPKKWK
jgi:predicted HicB family RNase H-like nuclease